MKHRTSKMKLQTLTLALVLLAGGCTVGPNYRTPDIAVPPAWNETAGNGIGSGSPELTRWWTSFNDPVLDSLIERAVRSNLDLRLAEARIREARASRAVTASGAWPEIETSGSYTRGRSSENAFTQGGPTGAAGEPQSLYRTGFDASWELDLFGGVRRRVEAADARIQASIEDRRDTLVTLLGDVAKNYIDLRGFQRRLAVAQANLAVQKDTLHLTKVRFEAGLAGDLDVARSEAQVKTTAAQIPALESLLQQAAHRLAVLLGFEPGALASELSPEREIPALPPEVLIGLPSELLRRRPDIRRAEHELAAATAEIGAATADLFPKFSLTGSAGLQSISAGDWMGGGSRFWSVGPTVRWPLFDSGKIRANIEVQNARQEQALRQYEKTILTALEDVENALVNYSQEQARHRLLADAVASNRRAVEMANELYLKGINDFLNVLDTQRSLLAAENDLAQNQTVMASNLVSLYKALGGGWETD